MNWEGEKILFFALSISLKALYSLLEFHTTLYLEKVFARKRFAFGDKKSKAIFSSRRRTKTRNNEFPFSQSSPRFSIHFGERMKQLPLSHLNYRHFRELHSGRIV